MLRTFPAPHFVDVGFAEAKPYNISPVKCKSYFFSLSNLKHSFSKVRDSFGLHLVGLALYFWGCIMNKRLSSSEIFRSLNQHESCLLYTNWAEIENELG